MFGMKKNAHIMVCQTEGCKYKFLDQEQTNICCPDCGERVEENFQLLNPEEQYQANLAIKDFQKRRGKSNRIFHFYVGILVIILAVWFIVDLVLTAGNNRKGMATLGKASTFYPIILGMYLSIFSSPIAYPRKIRWALYSKKGLILRLIGFFIAICISWFFLGPLYYDYIFRKASQLGVTERYAEGARILFYLMLLLDSLYTMYLIWEDYYAHQFCRKISKFAH